MKNKQIIAAVLTLLFTAFLFVTNATAQQQPLDQVVSIPDANLAAAIREALDLPANHALTTRDMLALTGLDASNRGIRTLAGLEAAKRLTWLDLGSESIAGQGRVNRNTVSDVTPLARLTELEWLILIDTAVADVSPLTTLTRLRELSLAGTAISDVTPLARLTELEWLSLTDTAVADVSPLTTLTRLEELWLTNTAVADMSPLTTLTRLRGLSLEGTAISDVTPLARLTELEWLSLIDTAVADVSPLTTLARLEKLWLDNTAVSDVSLLTTLTRLRGLSLAGTAASDVTPLARLTELEWLSLNDTAVADLTPLTTLARLEGLWLNNTAVADLTPLTTLTRLTELYLWDTGVSDVAPLASLTELESLDLSYTGVSDVAPLASLIHLETLWLDGCLLSDAALHTHIPALQAKGIYVVFDNPTEFSPVVQVGTDALPPMYWIDTRTSRNLYRLTGDAVKSLNPYVQNATSIAVDVAGNKVYWTEQTGERSGRIFRSNFNSSTGELVRDLTSVPRDLAIDSAGGTLYLTNSWGKIQRLNVDGSGFRPNLIIGLESPQHLALDVAGGKVYWTAPGSIWRATLTGKNKEKLIADLGTIGSIAVAGTKIYWTEANKNNTKNGKVRCAALDGSNVQTLATLLSVPIGIAVDAVDRKLYWTNSRGRIQRANLAGKNIQNLVTGLGMPAELALGRVGGRAAPAVPAVLQKTVLLPNYPNPFNPETWIPYQLSKPAEVTVTIYAASGAVVRTLVLGHQAVGRYENRSRAAYWDGRNALGERVASGVYFYTLTAGEFHATRKMLILK